MGDIRAGIAACHYAERAYLELVRRYGRDALAAHQSALLDAAEAIARTQIAAMPDGTYRFVDQIDSDGIDPQPIPIRVALTVAGDELTVDFDGTASQVQGAINSTYSFTKSAVYFAARSVMAEDLPDNEGYFRPIRVLAPEGSIVNPRYPAACGARGLTAFRSIDALFGAFAQAIPERVRAAGEGGVSVISIGGRHADGAPFIYLDILQGAWGGRAGADGEEGITNPAGNMTNTPVELAEVQAPLRIERYAFVPDSGGAGQFRGGLALQRDTRFLCDEATVQIRSDRRRFRPYGLRGGRPGTPSTTILNPGPDEQVLEAKATLTLRQGDLLRHVQPGAGGYGPPSLRDPDRVLEDVLDEKISPAYARDIYGVVIDAASGTVDRAGTERLRAALDSGEAEEKGIA
jgi:N-methylhydantoinase B